MVTRLFAAMCVLAGMTAFGVTMPEVVSHRGESLDRPENTMAAFRLAFERGVDGVECDVYCTSDGVPVIIHDSTTGRTAGSGVNLTVTSSTWDQLKDVQVGKFSPWIGTEWEGETLPKFEDYLALLSLNTTTKCIVELKGNGANNLVAKVVEAVRAQPLATKDRVAFIAFDASLISAVRAALPDYDALLLLSSVSDSAATVNSKIAACSGTGVDIHYQAAAAQSAAEIQAVKAAGYKFWVWTCDDVNESFALASRGVQSVTTNKGGDTKTAIAAMIEAAENVEPVVNPDFPSGLTLMEPGAYAQQARLQGHFDGIRNAGADLPHDPDARTWKNLVSGGPDAPFTGGGGYWTDKGFYFDGSSVYARLASPGIDLNHETATIQLAVDTPTSQQPSGKGFYPGLFYSSDDDDIGFFLNNNNTKNTKDTTLRWKVKAYRTDNRPEIANWGGKYATGIFMVNSQYLIEGTTLVNPKTCTSRTDRPAKQWSWGGSARENPNRYARGMYYSVRIYDVALTESELAWNRILDDARFRGEFAGGCVAVASNRAGAEGTEATGSYYVNGAHTFTVPASVTIDGCIYEPTGYKLESYNATTKTWNFVGESTDLYFTYTTHAAATGARITWNWRLASGVKKIDADDYVQGGLLLHFDGIRNAGLGAAHDSAAATWKNLGSAPGDATLAVFDAERSAGAWTASGYDFDAGSCFATDSGVTLARQTTVQFAVEYNAGIQLRKWPSFFGPCELNGDLFNSYTYTSLAGSGYGNQGDHLRFNTASLNSLSFGVQPWDGRFACVSIDNARSSVSAAAEYAWTSGTYKADIGSHKYALGSAHSSAANRKDRAYKGVFHAFRLYDRVLTAAELARNQEIDNMRFYAGAGRYSGSDLVEVACEMPGAAFDDLGCWILRGDGASKTFAAPATITVGNCTYSCTGYRMETWNAAKRMWENPIETTGATTAELSSASQNRRLTWLYALTNGIRSAADYDVHDYVQQGLVANYDGIRNFGPGADHASLGMFWRDSSYRDVNMAAASNTAFNAWTGKGHRFTAADVSFFEMAEPISLGQAATIQAVLDTVPTSQTTKYPLYFGFGYQDRSFFTRESAERTRLEVKYPDWIGGNLYCTDWAGKYFTSVISPTRHYLIQGTELGEGSARTVFNDIPANKMAIGAPSTYPNSYNDRKIRCMSGDYYALRIYNRALTDAELAHNRAIDEIRYRGEFPHANVTVACEPAFEGAATPISIPAGDYEVTGSWTFSAESVAMGDSTLPPRYTIETWSDGAWSEPVEHDGASYTYEAGGAKVRLTWKWADPTVPVKATWTGLGDANNLLDPANWSSVNAAGETISAAPMERTTVVIDGTTSFTVPQGAAMFPCKKVQVGGENHTVMRLGSLALASNAGFDAMQPGFYTIAPASDTTLAGLNGGNAGGPHDAWQKNYVKQKRGRFDGWINVTAAQAGTWTIRQAYDDYFAFALDGEWLIVNNTYTVFGNATLEVAEGWHRFTIVCGDTTGGYGSTATCSFEIGGENVPLSVSCGGEILSFTSGAFELGTEAPATVTLAGDADWRALGAVPVANGAVIDLNGHNLDLSSISSEYLGAVITNSNDSALSTVTFTAPEGAASTNNVAICGNVKVVKKGPGPYYAYATGCTYTGGTFIDEGTAQPPDGNGADTLYCWDQFKAFGLGEIVVASNAVFDLRANYAYRSWIVLNGGSLVNTKADMGNTTWGGSGIGRLTADSYLGVTNSVVFGDNNAAKGDTLDLGGHTLTAWIGTSGKYLYLRCAKIENGKIDIRPGGWLQVVNACVATNVDFKVNCALNIGNTLSVRDYEALWTSNNTEHNKGTAALNVYGTFRPNPSHDRFYGCTMQDGSTIDLSGRTGAFSTLSSFTTGSTSLKFASGATVKVKLSGRTDFDDLKAHDAPCFMTWPENLAPAADVKFEPDDDLRRRGFRVCRDDEAHGLRLSYLGGTVLIVR
ncbi:MAG: hypothetical protein IKL96_05220 [Kiritimatiellae bacterium]|nr:hypothetical protein [Kiritimatiellia bacterium]